MSVGTLHADEDSIDWAGKFRCSLRTIEAELILWIGEELLQSVLLLKLDQHTHFI